MAMTQRTVTEDDFRQPEFRGAKPEDYEFNPAGELVRKDRWMTTVFTLASVLDLDRREGFELVELVDRVRGLAASCGLSADWTHVDHENSEGFPTRTGRYDVLLPDGSLLRSVWITVAECVADGNWAWDGAKRMVGTFSSLQAWRPAQLRIPD
jgi:hypothetical protein